MNNISGNVVYARLDFGDRKELAAEEYTALDQLVKEVQGAESITNAKKPLRNINTNCI